MYLNLLDQLTLDFNLQYIVFPPHFQLSKMILSRKMLNYLKNIWGTSKMEIFDPMNVDRFLQVCLWTILLWEIVLYYLMPKIFLHTHLCHLSCIMYRYWCSWYISSHGWWGLYIFKVKVSNLPIIFLWIQLVATT